MQIIIWAALALCWLFQAEVSAAQKNSSSHKNTLVIRQIEPKLRPFSFYHNNQPEGVLYWFGRTIAQRLDVDYELQLHPWSRVQKQILDGKADIEVLPEFGHELPGRVLLKPPIGFVPFTFYLRSEREKAGTEQQLIGVPGVHQPYFAKRLYNYELFPYDGFPQGVTLLLNKRLDGLVINRLSFEFLAREQGLPTTDLTEVWTKDIHIFLSLSKASPFINSQKLRQVVSDVAEEKLFNRLVELCLPNYRSNQPCHPNSKLISGAR